MLADNALTTIEQANKVIYGGEATEEEKETLAQAINAASSAIEFYCRRKFKLDHYIQRIVEPDDYVLLTQYPVHDVISINGVDLDKARIAYYIDKENGILDITNGRIAGVIEYTAGYILPKDDENSDLPKDLELACLLLAEKMHVSPEGITEEVGSIKLGDWTVRDGNSSQQDIDSVIPAKVRDLIDNHARHWVII